MKVCQNFIKSYVPGKYLLADALSCPPGMFHLGCKVPAKRSMCNPLRKIRHPLLWQEQNCLKEQNSAALPCGCTKMWVWRRKWKGVRHYCFWEGCGVSFWGRKAGRKDLREGTARLKIRRNKCERRRGQENLWKSWKTKWKQSDLQKTGGFQNSGVRGKSKRRNGIVTSQRARKTRFPRR